MFSIKQFLINASSEVRQEIKNLINEIEASISTEAPAAEVDAAPIETETPAAEVDAAPIETETPAAEVDAAPIETEAKAVEADAPAEE